jgi:hypothetical protein
LSRGLAVSGDFEVNDVIEGAVLSDSDESRLVVSSGVDGRYLVGTSGETTSNISGKDATLGGGVQALEEREDVGVGDVSGLESIDFLDNDVGVTDEGTGVVDLLRGSIVVLLSVDEITRDQVVDLHLDSEGRIGLEGLEVLRELELRAGHLVGGEDAANDGRVAAATTDLLTVGEGDLLGSAEVDEVVLRGEGRNLTRVGDILTIVGEVSLDLACEETQASLRIATIITVVGVVAILTVLSAVVALAVVSVVVVSWGSGSGRSDG